MVVSYNDHNNRPNVSCNLAFFVLWSGCAFTVTVQAFTPIFLAMSIAVKNLRHKLTNDVCF